MESTLCFAEEDDEEELNAWLNMDNSSSGGVLGSGNGNDDDDEENELGMVAGGALSRFASERLLRRVVYKI